MGLKAEELKRYDAYPLLVDMVRQLGCKLDLHGQHGDMVSAYSSDVAFNLKAANALLKAIGEKEIKLTGVDLSDPDIEFLWDRPGYMHTLVKQAKARK